LCDLIAQDLTPMEQRQWPRYQVDWTVKVTGIDPTGAPFSQVGISRNISARGILVNLPNPPSINQTLSVCVLPPQSSQFSMEFDGEVVRVESTSDTFDVAIAFHHSAPDFTDCFRSLV
jgi:hypothetical protein